MEKEPITVECCKVDENADLQADELSTLICDFDGKTSDANIIDGTVSCYPPKDLPSADVEQQGIRLRVTSKATNRSFHEGTWTPPPPPPPPLEQQQHLTKRQSFAAKYGALKPFAIISCSYLLFTITDGAVRMIVLLHAYNKGFTAMQVAIMFSFYELAGVFTNLAAGLMGARWGIKTTLLTGLCVQLCGLGMLFGWQDDWTKTQAIIYVTASQALCGIAKDLTKLGGKTVTKLVTPDEKQSKLFKLVSLLTGFKNSLKGAGYFLGAATVGVSYYLSLGILIGLILLAFPWAIIGLSNNLGRARKENVTISQLFNNKHNVNILSLSRIFLFGSRDLWFEVPLPFFLRSPESGIGWSRTLVGAFLGIFIIVYGQVQSWTPQLVLQPLRQSPPDKYVATYWCALLAIPIAILGGLMLGPNTNSGIFGPDASEASAATSLTVLLYVYCILFAVNSSIHSYLIVRYAEGSKVAMNVGVYYCANAIGRLVGTITSGALYSYVGDSIVEGMGVCLFTAVGFSLISTVVDVWLVEDGAGKSWMSPFNRCCGKEGSGDDMDGNDDDAIIITAGGGMEKVGKESKEGEGTGSQATAAAPSAAAGINVDNIQLANMSRQTTF